MSLLMKRRFTAGSLFTKGISKLSELTIDADKDMSGRGVYNLKELAPSMQKGDIIYKGAGGVLVKLSPGPIGYELTCHNPNHEISWEAPPIP